ncbi:MAG: doxx family protein [Bacteroidetes bacterium]|nr:doxx family protein [Bacteroidota bacterium]
MIRFSILLSRRQTGNNIIAISIGIVYLWFGILKFFPNLSPAEEVAKDTINILFLGMIPSNISIIMLAIWETVIGLLLLTNNYQRLAITLGLVHITLTFIPFIVFPDLSFGEVPFSFTLLGQYIAKNIIILSALISLLKRSNETTYKLSNIN